MPPGRDHTTGKAFRIPCKPFIVSHQMQRSVWCNMMEEAAVRAIYNCPCSLDKQRAKTAYLYISLSFVPRQNPLVPIE
eukprot:scaffold506266_cov14-Prasinocladus_malaysianus.AAC.1